MKYHIPPTYYSTVEDPLTNAWKNHFNKGNEHFSFRDWLKNETGVYSIHGDFEEGWRLYWEDEVKYTWFLLKWAK
jgi:hypothetical protein